VALPTNPKRRENQAGKRTDIHQRFRPQSRDFIAEKPARSRKL
jgi:hypothetical protein